MSILVVMDESVAGRSSRDFEAYECEKVDAAISYIDGRYNEVVAILRDEPKGLVTPPMTIDIRREVANQIFHLKVDGALQSGAMPDEDIFTAEEIWFIDTFSGFAKSCVDEAEETIRMESGDGGQYEEAYERRNSPTRMLAGMYP